MQECNTGTTARIPAIVAGHTLLGGPDNPNCFTLDGGVKIVNMKLGPFERVREQLNATDVEVTMLSPYTGVITDPRFPENELTNDRWCTVCCPTSLLPEEQLRNYLRRWRPHFWDGILMSWCSNTNEVISDEEIETSLKRLQEYHGKAS